MIESGDMKRICWCDNRSLEVKYAKDGREVIFCLSDLKYVTNILDIPA
jgi:hypothetical protein